VAGDALAGFQLPAFVEVGPDYGVPEGVTVSGRGFKQATPARRLTIWSL